MNIELRNSLAELLSETGRAHHKAFAATDGADPDWPIWYADYLTEPFARKLNLKFFKSQLIYCLMDADFEHQALSPDSKWPEFYANEILERYAPSDNPNEETLALYHYVGCPFCSMVRATIDQIGVEVELRDIYQDAQHRDDLIDARGRATVPVLRIVSAEGDERWMPESRDIVSYLRQTYG